MNCNNAGKGEQCDAAGSDAWHAGLGAHNFRGSGLRGPRAQTATQDANELLSRSIDALVVVILFIGDGALFALAQLYIDSAAATGG